MDKYQRFRQFISPFIKGSVADALLDSLADDAAKGEELSVAVSDQLTISTASEQYLAKRLAEIGITQPPDIGISDDAFREIGITINATKLLATMVHDLLEVFYGPEATRAVTTSGQPEPYAVEAGDELSLVFEDGIERTLTFSADDFDIQGQARANEISDAITRRLRDLGLSAALAVPFTDPDSQLTYVRIFGTAKGPYSLVQVTGGKVQDALEFSTIRDTNLPSNTTVWQITRNAGQTLRFRWDGGPSPKLDQVFAGDRVLIYGTGFANVGIQGTFTVTNVRPPKTIAAFDAGWFEVEDLSEVVLKSSAPDVAPPPNTISLTYSYGVSQANFSDLKFFLAKKNTPNTKKRFAVGFEPANDLLRVYLPATTRVVGREPVGAAYLHMQYLSDDLDGAFGSASDPDSQIQIINSRTIRYRQARLDNYGTGGTLTLPGPVLKDIDYAFRENDYATIVTVQPHGLVGYTEWLMATDYLAGSTVYRNGSDYLSTQNSGPSYGGARDPLLEANFWRRTGPGINRSTAIVGVQVGVVPQDDLLHPFPGPYMADPDSPFTLASESVKLRTRVVVGSNVRSIRVLGTLPAQSGILLFDLNRGSQEYPVKYIAAQNVGAPSPAAISTISQNGTTIVVRTSDDHGVVKGDSAIVAGASPMNGTFPVADAPDERTLVLTSGTPQTAYATAGTVTLVSPGTITEVLVDPAHEFVQTHEVGGDAWILSESDVYAPEPDGSDYPAYVTSTAEARVFCEDLVRKTTALGIRLEVIVIYPDDAGLGNEGYSTDAFVTPHSEVIFVWGT